MRSVNRTPMSPARALSVVPPPTPKAARMPPTTALTMPLRIRLAPSAASQPRTMLVQLVPSSASRLWRSATRSSRTSPALRGADSSLLSDTLVHLHTENQSLGSRTRHQISKFHQALIIGPKIRPTSYAARHPRPRPSPRGARLSRRYHDLDTAEVLHRLPSRPHPGALGRSTTG